MSALDGWVIAAALLLAAAWWVVLASERIIEVARVGYTISA